MSLLIDHGLSGAQTHALIIGVGAYPDLLTPGLPADLRDLLPLPSSSASALAMVDWLENEYDNPTAPLGTVECLISDQSGPVLFGRSSGVRVDVERATMAAIQSAFGRWYGRCDADPGNIALFYFCGHGFMKLFTALLTEDFGRNILSPFRDAINFDMMALGMTRCRAGTQILLADACRQVPRTALQMLDDLPTDPLVDPKGGELKARRALVANAATAGLKAFTRVGRPTQFTQALLQCLRGEGSQRVAGGGWAVTLAKLAEAIQDAMDRIIMGPDGVPQACEVRTQKAANVIFHRLKGKPDVPVRIGCRPAAAMIPANFAMSLQGDSAIFQRRSPLADLPARPWELVVPAGMYNVSATFDSASGFQPKTLEVWAIPPSFSDDLEVQ